VAWSEVGEKPGVVMTAARSGLAAIPIGRVVELGIPCSRNGLDGYLTCSFPYLAACIPVAALQNFERLGATDSKSL